MLKNAMIHSTIQNSYTRQVFILITYFFTYLPEVFVQNERQTEGITGWSICEMPRALPQSSFLFWGPVIFLDGITEMLRLRRSNHTRAKMFVESYNASFTLGTSGELRGRLHEKISARAETECESGNRCFFIFIVVCRSSTHTFMNFQPGLKFSM